MSFPLMLDAFQDWAERSTFKLVKKVTQDHEVIEQTVPVEFVALFYPLKSQALSIKPEGQRAWKWWSLVTAERLSVDYVVQDAECVVYRVMSVKNWSMAGFWEYELTEAFK